MRAIDITEQHPMVDESTDALEAAKLMASRSLPGLVIRGDGKHPYTVLPASQVLRFVIPTYVQENPALARVYDEKASDLMATKLAGRTVGEVMPPRRELAEIPRVNDDDTLLEVCAVMASFHSPIVVVGHGEQIVGTITIRRLLEVLFPDAGPDSEQAPA
ncbi:MAG: CBS domain-containing protein [Humibacillus sp.]|nr:CBS domain-containing protein [Humibacillus sp.]MDN5777389.1 CBS domain-containing protein [Humibacillus sp.]